VKKLSHVASVEPQAAFVALSKSVQNEWLFVQRVVANSENTFSALSDAIKLQFIPNLFGSSCNELELDLWCRSTRHLGIGIFDPIKTAAAQFQVSKIATAVLSKTIANGDNLDITIHESSLLQGVNVRNSINKQLKIDSQNLIELFPEGQRRSILRKLDQKCSSWLSIMPSKENHFDLSPDEFRDSLSLRYGRTPVN
jgi:hypothetical protein